MNWKKLASAVMVYLIAGGIYLAFFSYPAVPAAASAQEYHLEKEEQIYSTPYAMYRLYVRESSQPAILIVATVRTPFLPSKTYSRTMGMVEDIMEREVKERYGVDIDVVFNKEITAEIGNHSALMQDYDIHLKYLNGLPGASLARPDTIKMDLGAYFCQEKYESVVVAYVYPPVYSGDFEDVMASVSC
jgi:hypothetical protein